MGCWNGTCGVSQMAILSGEPVVGFLLAANLDGSWDHNGHCHSDAYWGPYSLHIEGTYNDYGAIENVDETDWNYQFTLARLKEEVIEKEVGENKYHDIEIKRADLCWEYISKAIHESRLELPVNEVWHSLFPQTKTRPIGLMMVHKDIVDAIVASGLDTYFNKKITVESLIEDGNEMIAVIRNTLAALEDETSEDHAIAEMKMRMGLEYMFLDISDTRNNNLVGMVRYEQATGYKIGKTYVECMIDLIQGGATDEQIAPIIRKLAEFFIFNGAFSCLRKTWMPQAGAGSQHDEYDLMECVNNATSKIITDRKARWDE